MVFAIKINDYQNLSSLSLSPLCKEPWRDNRLEIKPQIQSPNNLAEPVSWLSRFVGSPTICSSRKPPGDGEGGDVPQTRLPLALG